MTCHSLKRYLSTAWILFKGNGNGFLRSSEMQSNLNLFLFYLSQTWFVVVFAPEICRRKTVPLFPKTIVSWGKDFSKNVLVCLNYGNPDISFYSKIWYVISWKKNKKNRFCQQAVFFSPISLTLIESKRKDTLIPWLYRPIIRNMWWAASLIKREKTGLTSYGKPESHIKTKNKMIP